MLLTEKLKCIVWFYILLLSVKLIYLFIIKFIYLIYCKSRKINDILHSSFWNYLGQNNCVQEQTAIPEVSFTGKRQIRPLQY